MVSRHTLLFALVRTSIINEVDPFAELEGLMLQSICFHNIFPTTLCTRFPSKKLFSLNRLDGLQLLSRTEQLRAQHGQYRTLNGALTFHNNTSHRPKKSLCHIPSRVFNNVAKLSLSNC